MYRSWDYYLVRVERRGNWATTFPKGNTGLDKKLCWCLQVNRMLREDATSCEKRKKENLFGKEGKPCQAMG